MGGDYEDMVEAARIAKEQRAVTCDSEDALGSKEDAAYYDAITMGHLKSPLG
jgi:hypothetical protein